MVNKRFTLQEANDMLPDIRADLKQLQRLLEELEEQIIEHQKIKAALSSNKEEPLFELEGKIDFMQHELNMYMDNFSRKGILIKMIQPALLDFPSIIDGEEVLICWREGEERIMHYHGWHDGFLGRKVHPDA
ncbi:DUF2203 domain-containing protein [Paenibacillus sp. HB172176]|uniref:DUF2203 domain-containing protein n=1 Tax=Paenibacillus sp. HB172176 TaxID=2493690 RepID=UPI00143A4D27|nr:DUF2203 domain-containing protein [Paenibacillus sp. HB172176]